MDLWIIVCSDRPPVTVALEEGYDLAAEWHAVSHTPLPWYQRLPWFRTEIIWHVVDGVELPVRVVQTVECVGSQRTAIGFNA